jgi:DNA-binding response OmpR family regulator
MGENRLLLIDDEPSIREFITRVARTESYDVKAAANGAKFRHFFETFDPTLVMIDMVMPKTDGIDLLRYLAAEGCEAPIVVMTGHSPKYLEIAGQLGQELDLFSVMPLHKPFGVKEIKAILQEAA